MSSTQNPKISVISPSLNHGEYLRDTIESILSQTFQDFEYIVVDGGSTDNTLDILKSYPRIRWISEKETDADPVLEAYRKAFAMSRGEYIIQCCISDGFLSRNWFKMCNDTLDGDSEISLVYGLAQHMTEAGNLGTVVNPEFLRKAPPAKKAFFPYWLAYGYGFPEGNYCMRRGIFDACFPQRNEVDNLRKSPHMSFLYEFNTRGYLACFRPVVANFGRQHPNQRVERLYEREDRISHLFMEMLKKYRKGILQGRIKHYFRNGHSEIIGEVKEGELGRLRRQIFVYYFKYKMRKRLLEIMEHL